MADEQAPTTDERPLLDDLEEKFDTFQALRKSDKAAADAVLDQLGASDELDKQILLEVSARRPLGQPARFPAAHALAIRSLEVLDRNGTRKIKVKAAGPLDPIASYFVQLVTGFIVRSYVSSVIDHMYKLYARRWANSSPDDPARVMLGRARFEVEKLVPGFKRNPLGVPTFLLGGAALSAAGTALQRAVASAFTATWTKVVATLVLAAVFGGISWVVLRGAAIARRRIRLTTRDPLDALWQTIGRCGNPPGDQSKMFALIAMIILAVGWLSLPLGLVVSFLS
ncbi:MAG: hypothetical protein GY708_03920 [Actinomycetia bacterium]|nr:hypothetical protein [Actinomycetes bacterium]MCP4958422.1 hypothetical protein [Actinomycetes bacterium]